MTNNIDDIERFSLSLPITQRARRLAEQFARQQPTSTKAQQVRLNTLAVCVVNDYLQLMAIPTDVSAGDSWNPVVRLCADVADLHLTNLGRLECRPMLLSGSNGDAQSTCPVPPEVWDDRIGYVVVQMDTPFESAQLLGFVESAAMEELPLSQLHPPEALLDHLDRLMHPVAIAQPITALSGSVVQLSRWFQNAVEAGWQTVDALLNPPEAALEFAFRGSITLEPTGDRVLRAKRIELGTQPIVLVVELTAQADQSTEILVQVHPADRQPQLPPDVQLTILDESGTTFLEARSRQADNYIQLQLTGQTGERFSIRVAFAAVSQTEDFVI